MKAHINYDILVKAFKKVYKADPIDEERQGIVDCALDLKELITENEAIELLTGVNANE